MLVIGHRGSPLNFTENTWPSIAAGLVADGVEVDIRLTADKKIVCFHDATTARLSTSSLSIANSSLTELNALPLSNKKLNTPTGKMLHFEDLCNQFPVEKILEVEIKCGVEILPYLYRYLDNVRFQFKVICFSSRVLAQIKLDRPHYYTTMLIHMANYFRKTGKRLKFEQISTLFQLSRANAVGIHANFFWSYELKYLAQRLKCDLSMWTVNSQVSADFYKRLGCSSITTDKPAFFIN